MSISVNGNIKRTTEGSVHKSASPVQQYFPSFSQGPPVQENSDGYLVINPVSLWHSEGKWKWEARFLTDTEKYNPVYKLAPNKPTMFVISALQVDKTEHPRVDVRPLPEQIEANGRRI